MPLQNRADPLGNIVANPAKGLFMGNRGCLHDQNKQIRGRRWTTQSWVICVLEYTGRKREIMAPGSYTELFFLDEATALAAGHRPCAECRRQSYKGFVEAWKRAHGVPAEQKLPIKDIDTLLHRERIIPIERRALINPLSVPDAAVVADENGRAWIRWRGGFHPWSFEGYGPRRDMLLGPVTLVTPESTTQALSAGYQVTVHHSLGSKR